MSLRNSLKTAVARCTPLEMQHATYQGNAATGHATAMQPTSANPHEIGVSGATGYATPVQLGSATDATLANSGEKLRVAFASTCNTQPGPLTAHRLTADLLKAAMRRECLDTPLHLQPDLLTHFKQTYRKSKT